MINKVQKEWLFIFAVPPPSLLAKAVDFQLGVIVILSDHVIISDHVLDSCLELFFGVPQFFHLNGGLIAIPCALTLCFSCVCFLLRLYLGKYLLYTSNFLASCFIVAFLLTCFFGIRHRVEVLKL